ncbi:hypothetical protein [Desulfonatronospira sp.]|uniref:hypothetical protein n=1 Tax=Desulfonatronospira sp. TaxID=1962951 RepID=UPI0025C1F137|nr:hypothetical protein [Desulfonatronospira sp.]
MPVEFSANLSGGDYVLLWNTPVYSRAGSASPGAAFRQSTFLGAPCPLTACASKPLITYLHSANPARADVLILSLMDGRTALGRAGELPEKYRR